MGQSLDCRALLRAAMMSRVRWDIQGLFGEQSVVDEFRRRTVARLQLLPPHDPQFRRNRERVNRDAERENLHLEWDLGVPEEDEVG